MECYSTQAVVPDENPMSSTSWLGDLDSNQGWPGQSRQFYR